MYYRPGARRAGREAMNSLHWITLFLIALDILLTMGKYDAWSTPDLFFTCASTFALIAAEVVRNLKRKP